MVRILLLAALIIAGWYWWRLQKNLPQDQRRSFLWRSAFWAVLAISIGLVASGRMHWLGAGLAALIPIGKVIIGLTMRALPWLYVLSRFKTSPSQFRTKSLLVEINFASRQMDGEVLQGEFKGVRLSSLSGEQLQQLATSLKAQGDPESALLLQAYMLRNSQNPGNQSQDSYQSSSFGALSDEEALEILGLKKGASKEDINKAHKRLVQRLHPDRGGSDYLAAKINAAKDHLV